MRSFLYPLKVSINKVFPVIISPLLNYRPSKLNENILSDVRYINLMFKLSRFFPSTPPPTQFKISSFIVASRRGGSRVFSARGGGGGGGGIFKKKTLKRPCFGQVFCTAGKFFRFFRHSLEENFVKKIAFGSFSWWGEKEK